jgi:transposase
MGRRGKPGLKLTPQVRQEVEKRRKQTKDTRYFARLSALLWLDDGLTQLQVARLLGVTQRQVTKWVRIFRLRGLDELGRLQYQGDPGDLNDDQRQQLKEQIRTGCFQTARQIQTWIAETFHQDYSESGVRALLRRLGASYHKVSGFFWKADRKKQKAFVKKYRRHQSELGPDTRRYFVDACHPVWGVDLLYSCWLLRGQRFYVGVGNGRQRLNILGAFSPDDHEYLDVRLTRDNINGEQFVNLLRLLRERHPETKKFILYLDNAAYYGKPVVLAWLKRHPQFQLVPLPAYSPNLNLIERLWGFLRRKALNRWHQTFAGMQAAVSAVLDHLEDYHEAIATLMSEDFHILEDADLPEEVRPAA